jgi:peroxiredoxin family protein
MDVLGLTPEQLDPIVDGVEGVAAFYVNAGDGQVVFI